MAGKYITSTRKAFLGSMKKSKWKRKKVDTVHAGSKEGFVPGAELVFEANKWTGITMRR